MNRLTNIALTVLGLGALVFGAGCSHNPNKAEKIDTNMDRSAQVSPTEKVGVKDGNMIVQKKVMMNEELRKLQNDVYSLEDRVYGNREYHSQGLYGALKACRAKLVSKSMGGDGHLMWTEPLERITDKEDIFNIGIDEQDKIVGVSEEFLKDRISRFTGYKTTLQKREDEYQDKLEICDTEVTARLYDMKKKKDEVKEEAKANSDTMSAPTDEAGAPKSE
jgi:hypothetical protein